MDRRHYLGVLATTAANAVAGCTGSGTTLEQAGQDALTFETETQSRMAGHGTLKEGEFNGIQLWSRGQLPVEWTISTNGNPVDVWMVDKENMGKFREGKDLLYDQALSQAKVTDKTASGTLTPGKYRLVFENSGAYKTKPMGKVELNFDVQLQ